MNELEMEVFMSLVEGERKIDVAHRLKLTGYELNEIIHRYLPREHRGEKRDRLTKTGRPYKKRLSRAALMAIALQKEELTDEERGVLRVVAESPNIVLAAAVLGMNFKDLESEYKKMRHTHDF